MRRLTLLLIALLALAPTQAHAQRCEAPPGTSAVDQYCEAIPDADGTQSAQDARSQTASPSQSLDAESERALEAEGADGQAVLGIVARSGSAAPDTPNSDGDKQPSGGGDNASNDGARPEAVPAVDGEEEPSANPLRAVTAAVTDGDLMGQGFAWLLVALTVVTLGGRWIAYRSR